MKNKKLSLAQILTMALTLVMILAFTQQVALAAPVKKWVQASENNIHYGVSSDIFVNNSVRVDVVKVTAVWATRTDEASFTEVGHSWLTSNASDAQSFYAWQYNWAYGQSGPQGNVTPGTYVRYHTGYDYRNDLHYFWIKGNIVGSKSIPNMTSSWPATNAEREVDTDWGADNLACFQTLKFKNYEWGSWSNWAGAKVWYDNDPQYSNKIISATHVDVVRD